MTSRDDIYAHVKQLLVKEFELEPEMITPNARLYDDLDIDSIDAVDLMVELKNYSGKKLDPEIFKNIRTIDDVVSAVHDIMR